MHSSLPILILFTSLCVLISAEECSLKFNPLHLVLKGECKAESACTGTFAPLTTTGTEPEYTTVNCADSAQICCARTADEGAFIDDLLQFEGSDDYIKTFLLLGDDLTVSNCKPTIKSNIELTMRSIRNTEKQTALLEKINSKDEKITDFVSDDDVRTDIINGYDTIFNTINKENLAVVCLTGRDIITRNCKTTERGTVMAYVKKVTFVQFYSIRGKPYHSKTVYLCPKTYQNFDLGYWEGLFIHEISHVTVRTSDDAYGLKSTLALEPNMLPGNADTYRLIWDIEMNAAKTALIDVLDSPVTVNPLRKMKKLKPNIKTRLGLKP